MPQTDGTVQGEVIGFLLSPDSYPVPGPVEHVQTHGAHVFLCGDVALKIKRAVRYDYMDLSTPELRHAMLLRELELNRPTAPSIYRDVIAITRSPDGRLHLDGAGTPVEWVLRMRRFAKDSEMTAVAASGRLTLPLAEAMGRTIQRFHEGCPQRADPGDGLIGDILDELERVLTPFDAVVGGGMVGRFLHLARHGLAAQAALLWQRAAQGHVRRVHGDLHLGNLLLIDGQPMLFDALEFDERLGTCDVLYDLAFLLMDLCHRDLGRQANAVLNAWLLAAGGTEDSGLSALPLFLAVRATIRTMVLLQTDQATGQPGASAAEARRYLAQALRHLHPARPVLLAIGGVSGTGKTLLARELAATLWPCPGAVHLRTDTERKSQGAGISYSPAARGRVYAQMLARAAQLAAAGCSVVLDGTFLDPAQRRAAENLASGRDMAFCGLWLTAPQPVLIARVEQRQGDASDADAAVVRAQSAAMPQDALSESGWIRIDASGKPQTTLVAAGAALAPLLQPPGPTAAGR